MRILRIAVILFSLLVLISALQTRFGRPYISEKSVSDFSQSQDKLMMKAHVQVTITRCAWPDVWHGCRIYVADARGVYIANPTTHAVVGMLRLEETVSVTYKGQRQVLLTCSTFTVTGLRDVTSCKSILGEENPKLLLGMRDDFNTRDLLFPELQRLQREELSNGPIVQG